MAVLFTLTRDAEFYGLTTIFPDGAVYPVASDHPRFQDIVDHVMNAVDDDEHLLDLINPFSSVFKSLYKLSERVSRKGLQLYFDGDAVNNMIGQYIVKLIDEHGVEDDSVWRAYVNFLEKLSQNPSKTSQEHLFAFIEQHGISVLPDGNVLFFKGIKSDGLSSNAGYGIVDGVVFGKLGEGNALLKSARLPNKVGSIIEIPRSLVDDNRGVHCSSGLHVGNYEYANDFADKLIRVSVNPRDVVAVPNDYNNAKVRVCRYEVLEENAEDYKAPVFVPAEKKAKKVKKAKASAPVSTSKVAEFEVLINDLLKADPTINLRRYKSKRVTAARRDEFAQAATNLGLTL